MTPSRCLDGERACSAGGTAPLFVRGRVCTSENKTGIGETTTRQAFRQTRKPYQEKKGDDDDGQERTRKIRHAISLSNFVKTLPGRNCTPILGKKTA